MNEHTDIHAAIVDAVRRDSGKDYLVVTSELIAGADVLLHHAGLEKTVFADVVVGPVEHDRFTVAGTVNAFGAANSATLTVFIADNSARLSLVLKPGKAAGPDHEDWGFRSAFPFLFPSPGADGVFPVRNDSCFYDLSVDDPVFTISTFDDAKSGIVQGIQFGAQITLGNQFAALKRLPGTSGALACRGTIDIQGAVPDIQLTLAIEGFSFELAGGAIENVKLVLGTDAAAEYSQARLRGDVRLGQNADPIKVEASVLHGDFTWQFRVQLAKGELSLASGFAELAQLAGVGTTEFQLPEAIRGFTTFYLSEIWIGIDPSDKRIQYVSFGIASDEIWPTPIPDIEISDVRVGWTFQLGEPVHSHGYAFGKIELGRDEGKFGLEVEAQLPDFAIRAELPEGEKIDVDKIVNTYFDGVSIGRELIIDELRMSAEPGASDYELSIDISDNWPIVRDFSLSPMRFQIRNQGRSATGSMMAQFNLGKLAFVISATCPKGGGGWQFEGGSVATAPLPVGHFVEDLAAEFGVDIEFPEALDKLMVDRVHVAFDSEKKDFDFKISSRFPLDGHEVEVTFTAILTHSGNDAFKKEFTIVVTIGGEEFLVSFENQKTPGGRHGTSAEPVSIASIVAAYAHTDPSTDAPGIRDLVSPISPSLSEIMPDIKTPRAFLGYRQETRQKSKTSKWLFGVEFGAEIDFAARPPAIPVVNELLQGNFSFKLDGLQAVIAKEPFSSDELTFLKENVTFTLPPKGLQRASVLTNLTLGAGKHPILLEFGPAAGQPAEKSTVLTSSGSAEPAASANGGSVPAEGSGGETASGLSDGTYWIRFQKNIGPVHFQKIGIRYGGGKLGFGLDVALTTSGLTLSLQQLMIESPVDRFSPDVHLAGIGIEYDGGGAVHIGGSFLATEIEGETAYSGSAIIGAESFTLSAVGSYRDGADPSLYLYAFLDYPIGGPGFFFVTGLAGGFGYNRSIRLPTLDQLPSFPFVTMAMGGQPATAGKPAPPAPNLASMPAMLEDYLKTAPGQDWLSVGVRFSSYEMVQSFALLTAAFGTHFELSIMGLSRMSIPTGAPKPVAYAEVALTATFRPDEGVLRVDAKLTPASYVFSTDAKLTGGFAFYIWFNDDDFVISFGGYHPHFKAPSNYPSVPRLQLIWKVSDHLVVKGTAYFALTPAAIMAGGGLSAVWEGGSLRAWFDVGADFLMQWKPFHYEMQVHINIGATFSLHLLFVTVPITIHVGVELSMWGPPFGGIATVDLSIISFSVEFGSDRPAPEHLTWAEFSTSFLPQATDRKEPVLRICSALVRSGLVKDLSKKRMKRNAVRWLINPLHLEIVTATAIPAKTVRVVGGSGRVVKSVSIEDPDGAIAAAGDALGIVPMGVAPESFSSTFSIRLRKLGATNNSSIYKTLRFTLVRKAAAKAMWGHNGSGDSAFANGPPEAEATIPGAAFGLRLSAATPHPSRSREVPLKLLEFGRAPPVVTDLRMSTPQIDAVQPAPDMSFADRLAASESSRNRVIDALRSSGIATDAAQTNLTSLARDHQALFHEPCYRALG